MANYILRNINDSLWARFKERALAEGVGMRTIILYLIEAYSDGKIGIAARKERTTKGG